MSWVDRKSPKYKRHGCSPPFNWFGRQFGYGSLWRCDECGKLWEYGADETGSYWTRKFEKPFMEENDDPEMMDDL